MSTVSGPTTATQGPFREDGRVERRVPCPPAAVAMAIAGKTGGPGLGAPAYFGVIGVTTLVMAAALPGRPLHGALAGGLLLLVAWMAQRAIQLSRRAFERHPEIMPRSCAFTADGLVLEGSVGQSVWRYSAIRSVQRRGPHVVLDLGEGGSCVLCADAPGDEKLEAWIAARAPNLERGAADPERTRLLLAVLYVLLAAAAVLVLPSIVPSSIVPSSIVP